MKWCCGRVRNFIIILIFSVTVAAGCDDGESSKEGRMTNAYRQQLKLCNAMLNKLIQMPVFGGGYLDSSRFGFLKPSAKYEAGQCGIDMFETSFWWTGNKVLPARDGLISESGWSYYSVTARIGGGVDIGCLIDGADRACEDNLPEAVPEHKHAEWPAQLVVKLNKYPDLELWLKYPPPNIENKYRVTSFVLKDWKRDDGLPRSITCWGLGLTNEYAKKSGIDSDSLALMSKADLENIDFGGRLQNGAPCQMDVDSFIFKGGAGRVSFSTESLHNAPRALKAISEYISQSFVLEN